MSGLSMSMGVVKDAVFDMQRKLNNATIDTANDKGINEDMTRKRGKH